MLSSLKSNALRLMSSKNSEWVLLVVSLLPFFLISIFNQPTDDDFLNASHAHTDSFFNFQKTLYTSWTGRYTSNMLYALGYLIPDTHSWLRLIKLAPVLWLLALISSTYFALRAVLPDFGRSSILRFSLWAVLLFLCGVPLLASAIYWFCGAAVYTIGSILTLVLLGAGGRALRATSNGSRWGWNLLTAVTIIVLLGCNEIYVAGVACGIMLVLLLGPSRVRLVAFGWGLALLIGSFATIMAPGNFVRAATESGIIKFSIGHLVTTVVKDLYITQSHWAGWSTNGLLWLASLLFLPVALRIHSSNGSRNSSVGRQWLTYPHTLLSIIVALAAFMLLIGLPTLWFSNDIPQRIWNYTYFIFLPTWFLLVQYLVSLCSPWHHWLRATPPILLTGFRVLFFILVLTGTGSAVNRAYVDYAFRAREYDQAYQARYVALQQAQQAGSKTIALPSLVEREYQYPSTIFLHDLDPHAKNIANVGFASYFRLDSVYLIRVAVPTVRHTRDQ